MTREDLIKFSTSQQWRRARIKFYEEQKKTINRLSSVLSDMPKGSRKVQDTEAESLSVLLDKINEIIDEIKNETSMEEPSIKKQLDKMTPKYGLIIYHHYILGDTMKYIAREIIHNDEKYAYKLRDKALEEFDKLN